MIGDCNTITMLNTIALLITLTTSSITVIYDGNDAETKTPDRFCSLGTRSVSALVQVHPSSFLETVIMARSVAAVSGLKKGRKHRVKVTGVLGNLSG